MAGPLGDRRPLRRPRIRQGRRRLPRSAPDPGARVGGETMSSRADRLAAAVGEQRLDALLVPTLRSLRGAPGFAGTTGAAVIGPEVRLFFTDFRYVEQAAAQV